MNSAFPKGIARSFNRISPLSSLQLHSMSCPHLTWRVRDSWGRTLCRNTHLICLCTSVKNVTNQTTCAGKPEKCCPPAKKLLFCLYCFPSQLTQFEISIKLILMTALEHHLQIQCELPKKRYLDKNTFQGTFHSHNRDGCILPAQSH